ncbi:ATP-dependent helicase HrpB [Leucobacter denitrificans]|uniref:ATP-dependent helicase HrpB n=1 Tax=Leucobacter denitrificans TaxID=683042 RepID=A0A7G9S680_9MICO|nr:ATP-dependent helicase HrpB [Leucobacter denitrificans]QNN63355.1 ATP-dependent helicase HrpB [Leucobacter denitrificans]
MDQHTFDLSKIGAGLPVARSQAQLERAARTGAMVVTAPPGTGKTTFVPPLVANVVGQRIILTQPRRVAVRAAASRLAQLDGSELGERVGFTFRGERRVSARTRIEVVTPGVLIRRLLSDPGLEGIAAVVLDEVHERSVDNDLLLGMLAELRTLRDDLTLTAMSATLNAQAVAELLGGSEIVYVPSVLHPLQIDYEPFAGARLDQRGVTREYLSHLADVTLAAQAQAQAQAHSDNESDALVFVPGAREVDEVVRLLRARGGSVDVLPLHGRISSKEQDRAVRGRLKDQPHRIVVSTSLAESALTVPGVRLVIDSGLSREVRRDAARDMTGLVTVSASRSSAEQRAGRAARQGPGRTVRAYSEADFARMPAEAPPEILSADLLDAALVLAAWGAPGGRGLSLLTMPPTGAMDRAEGVLKSLDLVDGSGRITPQGTKVSRLPTGVRDARALLSGATELGDAQLSAEVVAACSDDHRASDADLVGLLRQLRTGRAPGAKRWQHEARRLERLAREAVEGDERTGSTTLTTATTDAVGTVVALARPEWIARRVNSSGRAYLFASGTRAAIPEGSSLQGSEWIAVYEVQRAEGRSADGTGAVIRLAAPLGEEQAIHIAGSLVAHTRDARIESGRVRVRERRSLGAIPLSDTPVTPRDTDTGPAIAAHLREEALAALRWSDSALSLRGRLALIHREVGEPWPDVSDSALLDSLEDWLGPDLRTLRADASLHGIDVTSALRRLLPWPEAARLDELAPERLRLPSGGSARINYETDTAEHTGPVVAAKLQELFGLAESPRLVDGRVPIQFHLLSPGRGPLAVTSDLASFWNGPYAQVRKEMRGRYPKHPWPEDPWSAQATALTNRRLRQQ